ncbi:MAG: helix-turn-helix domain-containing protein [bacterium]
MTTKIKNDTNDEQLLLFDNNKISSGSVWKVADVANYLGVSIGHVYNLKSQGKIPYRKCGKLLRFIPKEIIDWLNQGGI